MYAQVFNPFVKRPANCGGSTGECLGYTNGAGPAGEPDSFNPEASQEDATVRGTRGAWWDAKDTKAGRNPVRPARGLKRPQQWLQDSIPRGGKTAIQKYNQEVPSALKERKEGVGAHMQQLAMIYGVHVSDSDAKKYFGKDFTRSYKEPTEKSAKEYLQYLEEHLSEYNKTGELTGQDEIQVREAILIMGLVG